jgi:hypothetical protein
MGSTFEPLVKVDGFSLLVDDDSALMLGGAWIGFVQSLDQTGFGITAPKFRSHEEPPPARRARTVSRGRRWLGLRLGRLRLGRRINRFPFSSPSIPGSSEAYDLLRQAGGRGRDGHRSGRDHLLDRPTKRPRSFPSPFASRGPHRIAGRSAINRASDTTARAD